MILVIANVFVQEGKEEIFVNAANECISATLKEEGNISYALKVDATDKSTFTFVEQWQSPEALDLHMKSEHFKVFGASIGSILAKELDINVYDANKVN